MRSTVRPTVRPTERRPSLLALTNASPIGLARTIYIRCTYGIFGLEITKYEVYIYVYIRFWPTLIAKLAAESLMMAAQAFPKLLLRFPPEAYSDAALPYITLMLAACIGLPDARNSPPPFTEPFPQKIEFYGI